MADAKNPPAADKKATPPAFIPVDPGYTRKRIAALLARKAAAKAK